MSLGMERGKEVSIYFKVGDSSGLVVTQVLLGR